MKKAALILLIFISLINANLFAQRGSITPPEIKNRAFKFEFFSPLYGTLNFDYEQYWKNNINLNGGIGIIGIGFNDLASSNSGVFIKGGPRLYFSPDYYEDNTKRYSDFQGWYFNPEIILSFFKGPAQLDFFNQVEDGNNASGAIVLTLGRQRAIANIVTLDYWAGLGYNINFTSESDSYPWKFGYIGASGGLPIAFTFGFSVGILTK